MSLIFKKAVPADIPLLTKTAFASKGFWGYPAEWMEMWRDDLTMTEESILKNTVVKAFHEKQFVGFYVLIDMAAGKWGLDGFWILPGEMGKGYGKQLFAHLMDFLRQQKAKKLEVVSDPNANGFYEKMGGEKVGKYASRPEGRELDVFHINLGGS